MKRFYRVASLSILLVTLFGTNGRVHATGPSVSANAVQTSAVNYSTSAPQRINSSSVKYIYLPLVEYGSSGTGNILLMAGDICKHDLGGTDYTGNCKKTGDLVRSVLAANPGAQVQTLGDNINNEPAPYSYDTEYQDLYAPNWGSFLNVTHALEGNHDTYPPGGSSTILRLFRFCRRTSRRAAITATISARTGT